MEAGKKAFSVRIGFFMIQNNRSNEIGNHEILTDDSEMEEVENILAMHVDVDGIHAYVEDQQKP